MPVLRFRAYWEEDESVYRDILIKPEQTFYTFHQVLLQAFEFDSKHQASFFRSNDLWQRGREIILEPDGKVRKVAPLLMAETEIRSAVRDPNQRFIFVYDIVRNWTFLIELIQISREENSKLSYPHIIRKEGMAPSQYGTRGLVSDKLVEMEEKYDLNGEDVASGGFTEEGEEESGTAGGEESGSPETGVEEEPY